MKTIDLKKELQHLYQASAKEVVQVSVPTLRYLMVDGQGDPNTSQEFAQAVEALFAVSYTAKFAMKKGIQAIDYAVMPLEGLWWADDMSAFVADDKANWKWTMMMLQPAFVSDEVIEAAMVSAGKKKPLPSLSKLRVEEFSEGSCAQIMHVGPFSEEGPTIARLHEFCLLYTSDAADE